MFSMAASLKTTSVLGQRPSFLQHVASLAVVEAVTAIPGCEVGHSTLHNIYTFV